MASPLLIATGNTGKFVEFSEYLQSDFDCEMPKHEFIVEENGETYYENALKKALGYYREFRVPVLADDSGLEVDLLDGRPGVYSARWGGEGLSYPDRWKVLFEELAPHPVENWTARFRCVLCFYNGRNPPYFFDGKTEGRIFPMARGTNGFGYDPIFHSNLLGKTFGEASDGEKARISHRAEACRQFLFWTRSTGRP